MTYTFSFLTLNQFGLRNFLNDPTIIDLVGYLIFTNTFVRVLLINLEIVIASPLGNLSSSKSRVEVRHL
jgi:hypothetical protein